jgi:hypothetical protein
MLQASVWPLYFTALLCCMYNLSLSEVFVNEYQRLHGYLTAPTLAQNWRDRVPANRTGPARFARHAPEIFPCNALHEIGSTGVMAICVCDDPGRQHCAADRRGRLGPLANLIVAALKEWLAGRDQRG